MNFDKWTYKDFVDAFVYYSEGNSEELNKLLLKLTNIDYENYELEVSSKAKYDLIMAMNDFVKDVDITLCAVDFKTAKWNDRVYRDFRNAMLNRQADEVERLLREVATMEGVENTSNAPLTARQGCTMVRAVTQKYQDLLMGKV